MFSVREPEDGDEGVEWGFQIGEIGGLEGGEELLADDEPAFALERVDLGLLAFLGVGGFGIASGGFCAFLFREPGVGEFALVVGDDLLGAGGGFAFEFPSEAVILPVGSALEDDVILHDDAEFFTGIEAVEFDVEELLPSGDEAGRVEAAAAGFAFGEVEEFRFFRGVAGAARAAAFDERAGICEPFHAVERGGDRGEVLLEFLAGTEAFPCPVVDVLGDGLLCLVGQGGEGVHHLGGEVLDVALAPGFEQGGVEGGEAEAAHGPCLSAAEGGGDFLRGLRAAVDKSLEQESFGVGGGVFALEVIGEDDFFEGVVVVFAHDRLEHFERGDASGDATAGSHGDLVVAFLFRVGPDDDRGCLLNLERSGEFSDGRLGRLRLAGVLFADVEFVEREELDFFGCGCGIHGLR